MSLGNVYSYEISAEAFSPQAIQLFILSLGLVNFGNQDVTLPLHDVPQNNLITRDWLKDEVVGQVSTKVQNLSWGFHP